MKYILSTLMIVVIASTGLCYQQDVHVDTTKFLKLKAILIVGQQQDGTAGAMDAMDKIADFFEEKGVTVHKFYDDEAIWSEIVKAANGANFFVYSGHGSTLGINGGAGGICIETSISSHTLVQDLKLHDNALVILKSVCRGAGSSAGDNADIGVGEAMKRVTSYSGPFFEVGASAYYANNFGGGCLSFLENFFEGKSIKECHQESSHRHVIEVEKNYLHDENKQISITSRDSRGIRTRTTYTNGVKKVERIPSIKGYPIAYVGNPEYSINQLMK